MVLSIFFGFSFKDKKAGLIASFVGNESVLSFLFIEVLNKVIDVNSRSNFCLKIK